MPSRPATATRDPAAVAAYLESLPEDRRATIEAIRAAIAESIDPAFVEGLQYGMLSWFLPHEVYPPGYHANPNEPLPFASVGNQKRHIGLYLFCVYQDADLAAWLRQAWEAERAAGRAGRLDMGKSCVRIRTIDDLPLGVLRELFRRVRADDYVRRYEAAIGGRRP